MPKTVRKQYFCASVCLRICLGLRLHTDTFFYASVVVFLKNPDSLVRLLLSVFVRSFQITTPEDFHRTCHTEYKYCTAVSRSGCSPESVPDGGVASDGCGFAPVDLAGPGKNGGAENWTPGAHSGGGGKTLLSGEERKQINAPVLCKSLIV